MGRRTGLQIPGWASRCPNPPKGSRMPLVGNVPSDEDRIPRRTLRQSAGGTPPDETKPGGTSPRREGGSMCYETSRARVHLRGRVQPRKVHRREGRPVADGFRGVVSAFPGSERCDGIAWDPGNASGRERSREVQLDARAGFAFLGQTPRSLFSAPIAACESFPFCSSRVSSSFGIVIDPDPSRSDFGGSILRLKRGMVGGAVRN